MSTAEVIYELVKTLPEAQANQVLAYVESLRQNSQLKTTQNKQPLIDYFGLLKDSPSFNDDPVEIQRAMRREWD